MSRSLVILATLLLAGCQAYTSGRAGGGATVSVRLSNTAADAIGLGILGALAYEAQTDPYRSRVAPLGFEPLAPPMDPARVVREADCTRPIEDLTANLRCR